MILKHLFFFNVADQMQKPQTGRTRGLETVHVEEQGTGQQSRRATTLLSFSMRHVWGFGRRARA